MVHITREMEDPQWKNADRPHVEESKPYLGGLFRRCGTQVHHPHARRAESSGHKTLPPLADFSCQVFSPESRTVVAFVIPLAVIACNYLASGVAAPSTGEAPWGAVPVGYEVYLTKDADGNWVSPYLGVRNTDGKTCAAGGWEDNSDGMGGALAEFSLGAICHSGLSLAHLLSLFVITLVVAVLFRIVQSMGCVPHGACNAFSWVNPALVGKGSECPPDLAKKPPQPVTITEGRPDVVGIVKKHCTAKRTLFVAVCGSRPLHNAAREAAASSLPRHAVLARLTPHPFPGRQWPWPKVP